LLRKEQQEKTRTHTANENFFMMEGFSFDLCTVERLRAANSYNPYISNLGRCVNRELYNEFIKRLINKISTAGRLT
jgi:hypothetical protein